MNNKDRILYINLLLMIICLAGGAAYSIGISPDRLVFDNNEEELIIFNPNNFDVNYTVIGCEREFIEVLRFGLVKKESKRNILVRYNPKLNDDVESCSFDIFFSNNFYSTGFFVELIFDSNEDGEKNERKDEENLETNNIISELFGDFSEMNQDNVEKKEEKVNIIFVVVVSGVFVIGLILILKFF